MPEVAITGIGLVTPLGDSVAGTLAAWRAGTDPCSGTSADFVTTALAGRPIAVPVIPDAAARLGGRRRLKYMNESAVFGCLAAAEACAAAGLRERYAGDRIALFTGIGLTATGLSEVRPLIEDSLVDGRISTHRLGRDGLAATNPLLSFKILANMPSCLVSIQEGIRGENLLFSPWGGQSVTAVQEAWLSVAEGRVPAAVVGAADHPAHPVAMLHLHQAGLLPAGGVPASGAAHLVLEAVDALPPDRRRAPRLCEPRPTRTTAPPVEPLAGRLGLSFAAAPLIRLALQAAGEAMTAGAISEDGVACDFVVEPAA